MLITPTSNGISVAFLKHHYNLSVIDDSNALKSLLLQNDIFFVEDKVYIEKSFKKVFIDVGLSSNAPVSETLFTNNPDTLIYGFEPLPANVDHIKSGTSPHPIKIKLDRIGREFKLIPCALSNSSFENKEFYVASQDSGCSSLNIPLFFDVQEVISVPVFTLENFLKMLPLNSIKYIDFLKVDSQGSDLEIVSGAGIYLRHILLIMTEISVGQYYGQSNSTRSTLWFFLRKGFLPVSLGKDYPKLSRFLSSSFGILFFLKGLRIEIKASDLIFLNLKLFIFRANRSLSIIQS